MSIPWAYAVRRVAFVCFLVASSVSTVLVGHAAAAAGTSEPKTVSTPRTAHERAHETTFFDHATRTQYVATPARLRLQGERRELLAFPPIEDRSKQPLTVVYLHGRNGRAENGCPWLRSGASELGWLVCPEGANHEPSGTASWGDDVFKQGAIVSSALHAAEAQGASSEPGVAIGFSQGGYVALDLVKTGLGHFKGLVLIAAPEAHPSAKKLHDAGVVRVALAAGSLDAAHAPLLEEAKRLSNEGMETRFFDLGHVGHTYAAEDTDSLREAITWAGGIGLSPQRSLP